MYLEVRHAHWNDPAARLSQSLARSDFHAESARFLCPRGKTQRKRLSPGVLHQQSGSHAQVYAPMASLARVIMARTTFPTTTAWRTRTGKERCIFEWYLTTARDVNSAPEGEDALGWPSVSYVA
jgi:hypothetical protein